MNMSAGNQLSKHIFKVIDKKNYVTLQNFELKVLKINN